MKSSHICVLSLDVAFGDGSAIVPVVVDMIANLTFSDWHTFSL